MSPRLQINLYESGCSIREIAEMEGVAYNTMATRLKNWGVKMRPRGGASRFVPHGEMLKTAFLYEHMGWTTTEIGEALDLHWSTVRERLIRHGVELRDRHQSTRMRFARRPQRKTKVPVESIAI